MAVILRFPQVRTNEIGDIREDASISANDKQLLSSMRALLKSLIALKEHLLDNIKDGEPGNAA